MHLFAEKERMYKHNEDIMNGVLMEKKLIYHVMTLLLQQTFPRKGQGNL